MTTPPTIYVMQSYKHSDREAGGFKPSLRRVVLAFALGFCCTSARATAEEPEFDNDNMLALFMALPLKVLAHESGHYLGIKYLTDAEVYSFKYRIFAGRVSADPEALSGIGDASAAVLPAMASDRFLTSLPYRYLYEDGRSLADKTWRWLAVMQMWPSLYMTTDLIGFLQRRWRRWRRRLDPVRARLARARVDRSSQCFTARGRLAALCRLLVQPAGRSNLPSGPDL